MMNKKQTNTLWSGKYLLACPFLIVVMLLINAPELKAAWSNADFSAVATKVNPEEASASDSLKNGIKHKIVIIKQAKDSANGSPLILIDGKKVSEKEAIQIDPDLAHSIDVIKDSVNVDHFKMKTKGRVLIVKSNNGKLTATSGDNDNAITVIGYKKGETASAETETTTIVTDNKKQAKTIFVTTKTSNKSPLMIVDGIETESIQDIDPKDIESISVLKDASATKIYGDKGKNGVVIITSKKK